MEKIKTIILAVIFALTLIVILFLLAPRFDRYLDIKAVEVCSNASSYTKQSTEEEFTAKYPIEDLYNDCLLQTR